MRPAIHIENVSKVYAKRSHQHKGYSLLDLFNEILGRRRPKALRKDEFYAVKDFSLTVYPGETVALIGENGCGKSTTLKMVAGLIRPDHGFVQTEGRLQALIALGAGFNSDLSGHDNIRLAAATIGMSRKQVSSIVEEIEAFADIGDFMSSPVKHYSSGMYSRLGFSVAIHMRPDILIVDEILGVGDYAFQNKCFSKMEELRKTGVTILLVSHSHTKVLQLCKRAIWIEKGSIRMEGVSKDVVNAYLEYLDGPQNKNETLKPVAEKKINEEEPKEGIVNPRIYGPIYNESSSIKNVSCTILRNGIPTTSVKIHDTVDIEYEFSVLEEINNLNVTLNFATEEGKHITAISSLNGQHLSHVKIGKVKARVHVEDFNFAPGQYVITMPIHEGHAYLYRNVVARFSVSSKENIVWGNFELNYRYQLLSSGQTLAH